MRMSWLSTIVLVARSGYEVSPYFISYEDATGVVTIARVVRAYPEINSKILEPSIGRMSIRETVDCGYFSCENENDLFNRYMADFMMVDFLRYHLQNADRDRDSYGILMSNYYEDVPLWRGDVAIEDLVAPNMRIYPHVDPDTDWNAMREKRSTRSPPTPPSWMSNQLFVDFWLGEMQQWCEHGVLLPQDA
jgi:hypothetical protein